MVSAFFCEFLLGTLSLFIRFLVVHSKIVSYTLFVLYCTIKTVQICVQHIMIIFLNRQKYSAPPCNTDEIGSRRRFPLPVAPQDPMLALLIRHPLTLVSPSHPLPIRSVRPIQPLASQFIPLYQPAHQNLIYSQ